MRGSRSEQGLPELVGSPAQVKWALQIRAERMPEIEAAIAKYEGRRKGIAAILIKDDVDAKIIARDVAACDADLRRLADVKKMARAAWWIDRRSTEVGLMIWNEVV